MAKLRNGVSTLSYWQARKVLFGLRAIQAVGSVHAVTENGEVLVASNTGSQLAAYAYGAPHVIWIVGTQKIVKNRDEALKRIYEYAFPLENVRAQKAYGMGSNVSKLLMIDKEVNPHRLTIVFVNEKLGF